MPKDLRASVIGFREGVNGRDQRQMRPDGHDYAGLMLSPVLIECKGKCAKLRRWELKLELRAGKRIITLHHRVEGVSMVPCVQGGQGAYVKP